MDARARVWTFSPFFSRRRRPRTRPSQRARSGLEIRRGRRAAAVGKPAPVRAVSAAPFIFQVSASEVSCSPAGRVAARRAALDGVKAIVFDFFSRRRPSIVPSQRARSGLETRRGRRATAVGGRPRRPAVAAPVHFSRVWVQEFRFEPSSWPLVQLSLVLKLFF